MVPPAALTHLLHHSSSSFSTSSTYITPPPPPSSLLLLYLHHSSSSFSSSITPPLRSSTFSFSSHLHSFHLDPAGRSSNNVGTMWPLPINIPQCLGHSGGICLPPASPVAFSPPVSPPQPPSSHLPASFICISVLQCDKVFQGFVFYFERPSLVATCRLDHLNVCMSEEYFVYSII